MQNKNTYNKKLLPTLINGQKSGSYNYGTSQYNKNNSFSPFITQLIATPKGRERRLFAKDDYRKTTHSIYTQIKNITREKTNGQVLNLSI